MCTHMGESVPWQPHKLAMPLSHAATRSLRTEIEAEGPICIVQHLLKGARPAKHIPAILALVGETVPQAGLIPERGRAKSASAGGHAW